MLRNVLGAYIDSVRERDLDLPLLSLFAAMGFYDIHYTHGKVEFGKDFIAKRNEGGLTIQYSIQSKAGNISQSEWRNSIQGQILESVLTSLSHPNFDTHLPHQTVLLATGELRGNAALAVQNLNMQIQQTYKKRPILFWGRENLLDFFEQYGLTGIHQATATGYTDFAHFFLMYGKAMHGNLLHQEIETYTRQWADPTLALNRRLLRGVIEAEVLVQQCLSHDAVYEAMILYLGMLRMLFEAVYTDGADPLLSLSYDLSCERLHALTYACVQGFVDHWSADHDLMSMSQGRLFMTTYLVQSARLIEMAAVAYFTTTDDARQTTIATFLDDLIQHEPGCSHPLSDRYTIGIVLVTLILCQHHAHTTVHELLRQTTMWLCDRYANGMGLARFEADAHMETVTLLGYAFDFIDVPQTSSSLLATTVSDLTAFFGDRVLYADVVNDIKACHIFPEYWQAPDTIGVCRIESRDVLAYPNVQYVDDLDRFDHYRFADHIQHESATFQVATALGPSTLVLLMVLLRDRYFPKLWPVLAPRHQAVDVPHTAEVLPVQTPVTGVSATATSAERSDPETPPESETLQ